MESAKGSEAGEVLAHLPGADLLVVAVPLVALDADHPVDDVLVAPATERGAEDVVPLELAERLEQVRGERLEAASCAARRAATA